MYLVFGLTFVALCLHGLAIFCLCKHKKQNKTQKVLLINVSATEIFILLLKACNLAMAMAMYEMQTITVRFAHLFSMISFYLYILANFLLLFAMFLIIVDRFLCIHLHVRYSYVVTKIRLMKVIIAAWIVSTIIGLPLLFLEDLEGEYYVTLLVLNVVYIIMATVVYGIICLYLKRQRKRFQAKSKMEKVTNSKQFVVPFLIVITFIIFSSLPKCINVWLSIMNGKIETINFSILTQILLVCGFIVDPLIYVFFNKPLRDVALYYLRCKRFPLTASDNSIVLRNIAVVKSDSLNQSTPSSMA
ncbi:melanocyte-stimulating hormone receptor-like [Hydractinia symbiolongicarpus]|uniref:melanocyte-stimulating hormone receptor-like n=1 Tax=Hydractinia symbiolongicarpus TaxID=13093 RepID=UPI00254D6BBE|nr:melanocyte-stimulating hormone receptor-like [Hydractinia symbiolongicarpus]